MRPGRSPLYVAIGLTIPALALGIGPIKHGYLGNRTVDLVAVLPPAPVPGDPRYDADRAIFHQTRALRGSDRYRMATADVSERPGDMLADFACSTGIELTPEQAPRTTALLTRASIDTATQNDRAKRVYQRQRPFLIDAGDICQSLPLTSNLDYPSGHTTRGWTWALILSDLLPNRAVPILARGRGYGDSRFICGAHNESAVEAGRLSATVTMQVVRQNTQYQRDLAASRRELRKLSRVSTTPDTRRCAREAQLLSQRIRQGRGDGL